MKKLILFSVSLLLFSDIIFAQNDFTGIVKYKLSVAGSSANNTDSMSVIFDKKRFMVILYLPDSNRVVQKIFIDDFEERKSYKVDPDKQTYEIDTLKTASGYHFKNSNTIGQVGRDLCFRYKALLENADLYEISSAECLAAIDYRNSSIQNYSFLGVQPMIVDNRLVMNYEVSRKDGTSPSITVCEVQKMDSVNKYFDLWGYKEIR